jgi:hypothetical protein
MLITANEVIYWSRVSSNFPTRKLNALREAEEYEFDSCLGWEFYKTLLADKKEYLSVDEWTSGTYAKHSVVIYDGVLRVALVATDESPKISSEWGLAEKFKNEKYNELWCNYLARYLSLVVIKDTLPTIANEISVEGVTKQMGENFMPSERREVEGVAISYDTKIRKVFRLMDRYLKEEKESFPLYLPNKEESCANNTCRKKSNDWHVG